MNITTKHTNKTNKLQTNYLHYKRKTKTTVQKKNENYSIYVWTDGWMEKEKDQLYEFYPMRKWKRRQCDALLLNWIYKCALLRLILLYFSFSLSWY